VARKAVTAPAAASPAAAFHGLAIANAAALAI